MKGYVYALYDKNENDVYYIGSSVEPKMRSMQHKSSDFEYGEEFERIKLNTRNYNYFIVEELEFTDRRNLFDLEVYWIHQFLQWGFPLHNKMLYRGHVFNDNRIKLATIPLDVRSIIYEFQDELAEKTGKPILQTRAIYEIIREYDRMKPKRP